MGNGENTLVQEHRCAATDDANEYGNEENDFGLKNRVMTQQVRELSGDETPEMLSGAKPEHGSSSPFFSICSLLSLVDDERVSTLAFSCFQDYSQCASRLYCRRGLSPRDTPRRGVEAVEIDRQPVSTTDR